MSVKSNAVCFLADEASVKVASGFSPSTEQRLHWRETQASGPAQERGRVAGTQAEGSCLCVAPAALLHLEVPDFTPGQVFSDRLIHVCTATVCMYPVASQQNCVNIKLQPICDLDAKCQQLKNFMCNVLSTEF